MRPVGCRLRRTLPFRLVRLSRRLFIRWRGLLREPRSVPCLGARFRGRRLLLRLLQCRLSLRSRQHIWRISVVGARKKSVVVASAARRKRRRKIAGAAGLILRTIRRAVAAILLPRAAILPRAVIRSAEATPGV